MFTRGQIVVLVEPSMPSMLVAGKTYIVVECDGIMVRLDNHVWTYANRFKSA
jgi:hypothetical protein